MTTKNFNPKSTSSLDEKFTFDSITAQLKLDLPNHKESDMAKYVDLINLMLEDYMLLDLEVNGGKLNFINFIDNYGDKLIEWKSKTN